MPKTESATATNLIPLRVKKIARGRATLTTLDEGFEFMLPAALLPASTMAGEKLGIKILDALQTDESSAERARQLLEEIIN